MSIPDLTADGLLPAGVFECTLPEIQGRFGSFSVTDRRCELFEKLDDYVREARLTGFVIELLIDGSFVTGKPDPGDIDLIAILNAAHDLSAPLRPFEYNVVSRRQGRNCRGLHLFVTIAGSKSVD